MIQIVTNVRRLKRFARRPLGGLALAAACFASFSPRADAYGPDGHKTVGAVADRLIVGTPAGARVQALLGGQSLESAAGSVKESTAPRYHYTAIPVHEHGYGDGAKGTRPDDVVHMIRRCISVLKGGNDPQFGQREALRLLAHLIGDLHQPLNVGAAYLTESSQLSRGTGQMEGTNRGIDIRFQGSTLHDFWENKTVEMAMTQAGAASPRAFAESLTGAVPPGVNTGEILGPASRIWANEMLPVAREAYVRLRFGRPIPLGQHFEWEAKATIVNATYDLWATQMTRRHLALGGYRLAAVLKRIWPGEVNEARRTAAAKRASSSI